jgi:hypothetical protein
VTAPTKRELKAARSAEKVVERAQAEGAKPLAEDVLRRFMLVFASIATAFQPGTKTEPNAASDPAKFEKYSRLAIDCAKALIAYETARPVASSLPPIEFSAQVKAEVSVAVDLSKLTAEQLIRRYRAKISGAPIDPAIDPPAAALPSPQPDAAPNLPAAIISNAPVEAEEPAEELVEIVGEPEPAPAAEPAAYAANVVGLITPEIVQRASLPRGVEEHARSLAVSQAGNQGSPHTGNPMAGQPIPDEVFRAAMRHPAMPRTSGVFDRWK